MIVRNIYRLLSSIPIISLILVVVTTFVYFLIPVAVEDKESWVIGPMSSSHALIQSDCQKCHAKPFSPIQNESCQTCHVMTKHPKSFHDTYYLSENVLKSKHACVDCHLEHSGDSGLVPKEDSRCVTCHTDIKKIKSDTKVSNVKDFISHPQFTTSQLDKTNIKLNHKVHLKNDLRSEEGYVTLNCSNCHKSPGKDGVMEEIAYQKDCKSCHKIEFEYKDKTFDVIHGDINLVFKDIIGQLVLMKNKTIVDSNKINDRSRPGKSYPSHSEYKEVVATAHDIEKDLVEKTSCGVCHSYKIKSSINKFQEESNFEIEKVVYTSNWFPHSEFNHNKHLIVSCENCHKGINDSEVSSDVHLPKIEVCQECHNSKSNTPTNCISCHTFHDEIGLETSQKRSIIEIK